MKILAPVAVLALVLASCSSKTESSEDTTPATTVAEAPDTTEAEATGPERLVPEEGVELNKQAQYAGWVFDFETLRSDEGDKDEDSEWDTTTTLEIDMKYTNLPDDSATPSVNMRLEVEGDDGTVENINTSDSDVSEVPGGGTGKGSISFTIDEEHAEMFDLDRTTLVLGDDSRVQARVPMSDTGELVSLMPQEQEPGFEDFEIGDWKFKVNSTELRWDTDTGHDAADKDTTWLAVNVDVEAGESEGRTRYWEWAFTAPDGTSQTGDSIQRPDDGGGGTPIEAGTTLKGVTFWFVLEDPVDGEYDFKFTGPFDKDGDEVSKSMVIELKVETSADADTGAAGAAGDDGNDMDDDGDNGDDGAVANDEDDD